MAVRSWTGLFYPPCLVTEFPSVSHCACSPPSSQNSPPLSLQSALHSVESLSANTHLRNVTVLTSFPGSPAPECECCRHVSSSEWGSLGTRLTPTYLVERVARSLIQFCDFYWFKLLWNLYIERAHLLRWMSDTLVVACICLPETVSEVLGQLLPRACFCCPVDWR